MPGLANVVIGRSAFGLLSRALTLSLPRKKPPSGCIPPLGSLQGWKAGLASRIRDELTVGVCCGVCGLPRNVVSPKGLPVQETCSPLSSLAPTSARIWIRMNSRSSFGNCWKRWSASFSWELFGSGSGGNRPAFRKTFSGGTTRARAISRQSSGLGFWLPLINLEIVAWLTPQRRANSLIDQSRFCSCSASHVPKCSIYVTIAHISIHLWTESVR